MRRLFEFYLLFIKIVVTNKVAFLWTLIFPIIYILLFSRITLSNGFDDNSFIETIAMFFSYIIFVVSINASLSLISLRETGFLKMFFFITGSKIPIVFGQILAQLCFLYINIIIVSLVFFFLSGENLYSLLQLGLLVVTITFIPISLFNLWITTLPIKNESIIPIMNIAVFPLIIIAFSVNYTDYLILDFFISFNPVKFIHNITIFIANNIGITSVGNKNANNFFIINTITYTLIGLLMLRYFKIISVVKRN
ncbi:hypothetical protein [Evansella cellulosilytica]|uniref:ABC-2 type transporter domain-containing protein n=1 Tax=Evansella cellulosilytica (strain ATCC 21833 / DSM 2522 / FERM P-1141 / JCM 9156 / N-4) TaxID=649639 RepID=E6TR51_EVAC2|nr:hypothetical protein [Evansella cellulosilytica]ADU29427.1 hypothetical protein Bcell_1161 [Evansella cellulosilytica DSM 2522]